MNEISFDNKKKGRANVQKHRWTLKTLLSVKKAVTRDARCCCSVLSDSWDPMDCNTLGFPVLHSLSPRVCSNSCPSSWWYHLILCHRLLLLPSIFPMIRVFSSELALCTGGRSIGASALTSVLPMSIQGWFPLGWAGWISLQSKGPSRVFSNNTGQENQFFGLSLLYGPTLTSIHDYWKNHSFN